MNIIPAIDIIDGKCVRLTQGDYTKQKTYNEDSLEVAKAFESAGIKHLHLVDLDGARTKHIVNYRVLEKIASCTNLEIDFGGGVKTDNDIRIAFDSGACKITAGSIAVSNQETVLRWLNEYSAERIILGADCKNRKIATNGWMSGSELDVLSFISEYETKGVNQVICTDVAVDGMLTGPSIELYKDILNNTDVQLVASGGVSSVEDIIALEKIGCSGAIVGKAIYEGVITLEQIKDLC